MIKMGGCMKIERIALLVSAGLLAAVNAAMAGTMKVTLLGTGTPTPRLSNFSASTLVEAGPEKLLFDIGRGSTIRLFQKHVPLGAITAHFITHLHSDHIVGLPDLWLSGWVGTPWASRTSPMVVFGPKGTVAMTENLTKAFPEDIRIREDDEHLPRKALPSTPGISRPAWFTTRTASRLRPSRSITARRSSPPSAMSSSMTARRWCCRAIPNTTSGLQTPRRARISWCTRSPSSSRNS